MPTEATIQRNIIRALRDHGVYVIHTLAAESGTPDLLACHEGRFVGLEVKQPGRYPTKIQRFRAEQIRAAGGHVATVRSVADALREMGLE